ncbi:hypothetical protein HBN50_07150 [Halobacteriovorax sp. GB3]|uniref:hypothetical protein n=1 Tax=Halobacteriovorax sp. GB3 TaxID=2719615 RepID=UPI00235E451A|nr:hypothetical protein [Halobacteriovorax sp. GB3]MDD0852865.1 hypothetical protein [Halobacteriovorax sp. GB3]
MKTLFDKEGFRVRYNTEDRLYIVEKDGKIERYPRHLASRLLFRHQFDTTLETYEEFKKILNNHNKILNLVEPTDEELIAEAFDFKDTAMRYLSEAKNPCDYKTRQYGKGDLLNLKLENTSPLNDAMNSLAEMLTMKEDGYASVKKTFKDKMNIITDENGEATVIKFGGGQYKTVIESVGGENKRTRQTVEIDGAKFEIRLSEDKDDFYIKVVGKEGVNNQYGAIAKKAASAITDEVSSESVDDLEFATEVNFGNRFHIYRDHNSSFTSNISLGREFGVYGTSSGYVRMKGDLRYKYVDRHIDGKDVSSFEVALFYDKIDYDAGGSTTPRGIEFVRRYRVNDKTDLFISASHSKVAPLTKADEDHREELVWDEMIFIGIESKF